MSFVRQTLMLLTALSLGGGLIFYGTTFETSSSTWEESTSVPFRNLKVRSPSVRRLLAYSRDESSGDAKAGINTYRKTIPEGNIKDEEPKKVVHHTSTKRSRILKRRKREVSNKKNYKWQFNVNLTRFEDKSTQSPLTNAIQNLEPESENSNKHLGVVVYVEGRGPDDSFNELNHAWNSVDGFLKQLFGGSVEELSEKGHGVAINLEGLPSKTQTDEQTEKPAEKDEKSPLPKDKSGKFLFGFFGMGGNNENPPMDLGSGETSIDPNTLTTETTNSQSITTFNTKAPFVENLNTNKTMTTQSSPIKSNFSDLQQNKTDPFELDLNQIESINDTSSTMPSINILSTNFSTLPTVDVLVRGLLTPSKVDILSAELLGTTLSNTVEDGTQASIIGHNLTEMEQIVKLVTSKKFEDGDLVHKESTSQDVGISTKRLTTLAGDGYIDSYSGGEIVSDSFTETHVNTEENIIPTPSILLKTSEPNTITPEKMLATDGIRDFCISLFSKMHRNPSLMIEFSDDKGRGVIVLEDKSMNSTGTKSPNEVLESIDNQIPQDLDFTGTVRRITDGNSVETDGDKVTSTKQAQESIKIQNNIDAKLFNLFPNFGSGRSGELDEFDVEPDIKLNATQSDASDILSVSDCEHFFNSIDMASVSSSTISSVNNPFITKGLEDSTISTTIGLDKEHTTVTPLGDGGNFLNIFSFGSGSSEVSEVNRNRDQFTMNPTQDSRFIFGNLNFGSGETSISQSPRDSTSSDIVADGGERSIGWIFGLGSGERQLNAIESTTIDQVPVGNFRLKDIVTDVLSTSNSISETPFEGKDIIDKGFATTELGRNPPQEERFFPSLFDFGSITGVQPSGDINFSTESEDDRFVGLGSGDVGNIPKIPAKEESLKTTEHNSTDSQSGLEPTIISLHLHDEHSTINRSLGNAITLVSEEIFSESTTENKQPKSLGSLFLTGSGDGGTINLIHEGTLQPSITSSAEPILKRGRLLDDFSTEWDKETADFGRRRGRIEANMEDFSEPSIQTANKNPALQEFENVVADPETTRPVNELISPTTSQMDRSATGIELAVPISTPTNILTSTFENQRNVTESAKPVCSKDSECEKPLNEYCILNGDVAVCDCGKSFVRHPETDKCETPILVETSMKLPGEEFHPDLKDESSELFQKMRKEAIDTIRDLLGHDPKLFASIAKVDVTGFEEGSLIVHYNIVFAGEGNKTVLELVEQVDTEIKDALQDENLLAEVSLNVTNAELSTSKGDQCESGLNYCSEDAVCIQDEVLSFRCRCREGYLDNSRDGMQPGQMCITTCPPSYCSGNGICNIKENGEKSCICNDWYFGSKCEVSGVVVIGGFSVFNILVVFFVGGIVCFCRKKRSLRSEHYGEESQHNEVFASVSSAATSARVTDAVALDVVGTNTAKYMAISTPMVPAIQVTSPSFMGSVISYDFDSTFDRTSDGTDSNQTMKL